MGAKKGKKKSKKSDEKVVLSKDYFDLLCEKAEKLDEIFTEDDEVSIAVSDFKDMKEFAKRFEKVDQTVDDYEPPPSEEE